MNQPSPVKGLRIRMVNIFMLCLSVALFIVVIYSTFRLSQGYETSVKAIETYLNWEKSARDLQETSAYLTNQARLFAQTGNRVHADNFFKELLSSKTRERAIELLESKGMLPQGDSTLQDALELSNTLAQTEIYAIRLIAEARGLDLADFPETLLEIEPGDGYYSQTPEERAAYAMKILYNEDFQNTRKKILDNLSSFLNNNILLTREALTAETRRLGNVVSEQRLLLIALCLLNILTFAMIIILIIKPLSIYLKCVRDNKMFELVGAYEFKHLAHTYNEIFAIKEKHEEQMRYKSEHDPLTGLRNRRAFDSLRRVLAKENEPVGLLLIDVDKFKGINDNYGHAVGDAALRRVAGLLRHNFRSNDFCARIGGDEFAVILPNAVPDIAKIVKRKIDGINESLKRLENDVPPLSISAGGAVSENGFTDDLYINADSALYAVKEAGRRGCSFYEGGAENKGAVPA